MKVTQQWSLKGSCVLLTCEVLSVMDLGALNYGMHISILFPKDQIHHQLVIMISATAVMSSGEMTALIYSIALHCSEKCHLIHLP